MINPVVFNRTLRNVLVIPLVGLLLLLTLLFAQVGSLLAASGWTEHTYQVIAQDQKVGNTALHMQSELRGYFLTDEAALRGHFEGDVQEFTAQIADLRRRVADNPAQVKATFDIESAYRSWLQVIQEEEARYKQNNDYPALIAQEQAAYMRLSSLLDRFQKTEEGLLRLRNTAVQRTAQNTRRIVIVAAFALALVMGSLIRKQLVALARSYGGALASLQAQADALQRNANEIQALNAGLEQRVQERTAQLEAANKELEAFSYSVSHDLRAPLRSIDGFSQALLEDYADVIDAEGKKYLSRLRDNSRKMAGLIDDLLGLSRLTRAEMKRAPVDLSEAARGVMEEIRQRDPERNIAVEIADNIRAEGDERLLRIALENLMGNAWKFSSKKQDGRIQFGAELQAGETVYFVRDNGAGFDMAYADKLFGAFQRLHGVAEFEGTGIGLAIVQRIIRRHGGRIWAEGAVGQGATFYFTLN